MLTLVFTIPFTHHSIMDIRHIILDTIQDMDMVMVTTHLIMEGMDMVVITINGMVMVATTVVIMAEIITGIMLPI